MTSPLDTATWPLRTERLTIRRATLDDAEPIWAYRREPGVDEWLTRETGDLDDFRANFATPERLTTTLVIELPDGTVIGDLKVAMEDAWAQAEVVDRAVASQAEIGWCLAGAHRGRGYAREAVAGLIGFCFTELGLRRVVAYCFADNTPSWQLMEAVGLRRETHAVRESLHRSRGWVDGYGYALLADEWRGSDARSG